MKFATGIPIDGVLFSLSYNTMPHHRMVLRRAWDQLRPGGRGCQSSVRTSGEDEPVNGRDTDAPLATEVQSF